MHLKGSGRSRYSLQLNCRSLFACLINEWVHGCLAASCGSKESELIDEFCCDQSDHSTSRRIVHGQRYALFIVHIE